MWLKIDPPELNNQVLKLDTRFWSSVVTRDKRTSNQLPRRVDKVIGGDLFTGLYHYNPILKPEDEQPNPAIASYLNELYNTGKFKQLRDKTMGDKDMASTTAVMLYQELMRTKEGEGSALKTLVDVQEMATSMAFDGNEAAIEMMQQNLKSLGQMLDKDGISSMEGTDATTRSISNVENIIDSVEELANGWGSGGDRKEIQELVDYSLSMTLQERDELKRLAKLLGQLRRIASIVKSNKPSPAPPPVGITTGNDLSSILAQEFVNLVDEDTENLFFSKYLDGSLGMYDRKEHQPKAKGPYIIAIDSSGSMRGSRTRFARAIAIAIAKIGVTSKRDVGLIFFASYASEIIPVKSAIDVIKAFRSSQRIGGGTDFYRPLRQAFLWNKIDDADILLITDGECEISSNEVEFLNKQKQDFGSRVFGLGIDINQWYPRFKTLLDGEVLVSHDRLGELNWFENLSKMIL